MRIDKDETIPRLNAEKWQLDDDSEYSWQLLLTQELTFILLARSGSPSSSPVLHPDEIKACPMVGDVNLFLPNGSQEDVECEIMIAGEEALNVVCTEM